MINDNFKENWLKIVKFNSKLNLIEDPRQLKEFIRIPLTSIKIDAFLLYHLFELLYPRFVNDQQNILDIIVSDFEIENIVFGIYLYDTPKLGIHSSIKALPKDSIKITQEELSDNAKLFDRLQAFFLKEHGIKVSCMRIIRKRGIDLINSHCEKLNKVSTFELIISLLDLLQISLERELFSIYPEPNFLRFFKESINILNRVQISKIFLFLYSLMPSFNTLFIMNSTSLPIALKIKKEDIGAPNSELDIKLFLLESNKYNLKNINQVADFKLLQSDFNVDNVVTINQNPLLLFCSELFEAKIPPDKEKLKLLLQKVLYGIRSYDLNWSTFPKPKINNFLLRFLIRLFGINLNLKKLSHWAISEFLFNLVAMYIGLNAKILVILTDKSKNNPKETSNELILLKIEYGVIKKIEYLNNPDLITRINQQSLESIKLIISEQFGFISNVLMLDKQLIKKIIKVFIVEFQKISIGPLLKILKMMRKPQYFRLSPEIPPYTLLKKKGVISFLRSLLSIVIDKHDF
ncbi:MAG: hypothetical protein ACXABG_02385 [Promethearchaeota archaeon]|jgi:hypothetical protein